jgi:hypothetical protein
MKRKVKDDVKGIKFMYGGKYEEKDYVKIDDIKK